MQWLIQSEIDVLRINQEDQIEKFLIKLGEDDIFIAVDSLHKIGLSWSKLEKTKIFMYQGFLYLKPLVNQKYFENLSVNLSISLLKIILSMPDTIGTLPEEYNFKLYNLFLAKEVGLSIPNTEIINSLNFRGEKISLKNKITKSVTNVYRIQTKESIIIGPGTVDTNSKIKKDDMFSPSLTQNKIKKQFEIRSVFFKGIFYSMAIFSQSNKQTSTDYRNYDFNMPNRCIPFLLPSEIENKLTQIANRLQLKFCSFDLIFNDKQEYVFIEVNPEGQIGWVSTNCNYNIEKKIADYLMS